jgi:hypothetical protein
MLRGSGLTAVVAHGVKKGLTMDSTIAPSSSQPQTPLQPAAPATTPGTADEQAALDATNAPPPWPCGTGDGTGTMDDAFPDGPRCPTCGTPRPPFREKLSGLLDLALQTREAASTLVNALEQEVLP